jgi:hypothetical protein
MATNQRTMWFDAIKSWCNNDFDGVDVDSAPLEVQKALDILLDTDANKSYGKSNVTMQGVVVESYTSDSLSPLVRSLLKKHRSMEW